MIGPFLEGLAGTVALLGVLSAAVGGITLALAHLFSIRARLLRSGVAKLLRCIRRQGGHSFAPPDSRRDAVRLLAAARSGPRRPPRSDEPEPPLRKCASDIDPGELAEVALRVLPDLDGLADRLQQEYRHIQPAVEKAHRLWLWGLSVGVAALLAEGLQLDGLALLRGLTDGLAGLPELPPSSPFRPGCGEPGCASWSGWGIGVALLSLGAAIVWGGRGRALRRGDAPEEPKATPAPSPAPESGDPDLEPIGESGQAVRAISFAGGGFDTLMQLGVTHALLVIKGRAPDAVVGVSAGAIQAAALAETLQAGGKQGPDAVADEDYPRILEKRVQRFREFLSAARAAPTRLIDAILPDAYQVDANDPLRPLETPVFAREERARRKRGLRTRSGLVRLYNDLLEVHVPIGTLTRIVRRVLGFRAAAEIRTSREVSGQRAFLFDKLFQFIARSVELLRIWLLVGDDLFRTIRLGRMLFVDPFLRKRATRPSTAGRLIFRFRLLERASGFGWNLIAFLLVVVVWVTVTWTVLALPFLAWSWDWRAGLIVVSTLLAIPLGALLPWFENLRAYEHVDTRGDVVKGFLKILVLFLYVLLRWTPVYVALVFALVSLLPDPALVWLRAPPRYLSPETLTEMVESATDERSEATAYWDFQEDLSSLPLVARVSPPPVIGAMLKAERPRYYDDVEAWVDAVFAELPEPTKRQVSRDARLEFLVGKMRERSAWTTVVFVVWLLWISNKPALAFGSLVLLPVLGNKVLTWWRNRQGVPSSGRLVQWYLQRFLRSYSLEDSLATSHPLENFLIEHFDPHYHGDPDFDHVVDRSLADKKARGPRQREPVKRPIGRYVTRPGCRRIHVGIAAADVGSGRLEVMETSTSIVDGLLAATAVAPLFPPKRIGKRLYIDGTNVGNVPMRGLMKMLRRGLNDASTEAHVYRVAPFPLSRAIEAKPERVEGPEANAFHLGLIGITNRALELRRHQDATMEQRLTHFYNRVIDPGKFVVSAQDVESGKQRRYFRAEVTPIELEHPPHIWRQLLQGAEAKRHDAVLEVVADGCRASLEVMLQGSLDPMEKKIRCKHAVALHLKQRTGPGPERKAILTPLPGRGRKLGPGLREVCEHCALAREAETEKDRGGQTLKPGRGVGIAPPWPHEGEDGRDTRSEPRPREPKPPPERHPLRIYKGQWPRSHDGEPEPERPVRGLLLSGGVFRGVFQMGVLNALVDLDLKPDVVAGASVGSITAAMAARSFQRTGDERRHHVARLAGCYLAVDRLIQTDRFADFVRNVTIRAASTRFSFRDADRLFRRFDQPFALDFDRTARRVIAGLERLLYVSPYQLNELTRTIRAREGKSAQVIRELVQQWLQRMEVGEEILGADPLEQLIRNYVIAEEHRDDARHQPFTYFGVNPVLLATATNLTTGRLDVLGEPGREDLERREAMLVEGLLTSSAFPGVFRPRWSWDLFPGVAITEQYIDGGVMDNLPFEATIRFLVRAADAKLVPRRPLHAGKRAPHLLIAASLEPDVSGVEFEGGTWLDIRRRAKQLAYNGKIEMFNQAERDLRNIYETPEARNPNVEPLDLDVRAVMPMWLPGTFGFHPMLGFRRKRQAESIAHGCASTLLLFAATPRQHRDAWRMNDAVPKVSDFDSAWRNWEEHKKRQPLRWSEKNAPDCWLRPGHPCPFSREQLRQIERPERLPVNTIQELSRIHEFCRRRLTHARGL